MLPHCDVTSRTTYIYTNFVFFFATSVLMT